MLIIMGTSLKVHGLKKLVKDFARTIHANTKVPVASTSKKPYKVIFVNKTAPGGEWSDIIDYHVAGETDGWSEKVIEDWKKMRPADWQIQRTLVGEGDTSMNAGIKTVKSSISSVVPIKTKKLPSGRENFPPTRVGPTESSHPAPPLSPSKRRQKTSHYDEVHSSPSKRQSKSTMHHIMPAGERKMLFGETTNKTQPTELESSKMDISLCDLSMIDVEGLEYCSSAKLRGKASTTLSADVDTSRMDISILADLSMLEEGPIIKARRVKAAKRTQPKGAPPKAASTVQRRVSTRQVVKAK